MNTGAVRQEARGQRLLVAVAIAAVIAGLCSAANAQMYFRGSDDFAYVPPPIVIDQGFVPYANAAYRFVPYPTSDGEGYYFWDYVNRSYPLTPEPIWRETFKGIRGRVAVEMNAIGVPGMALREMRYYRDMFERLNRLSARERDLK